MDMEGRQPEAEKGEEDEVDWGTGSLRGRRHARALALQALYEVDASAHTVEAALAWVFDESAATAVVQRFAMELAQGAAAHAASLDVQIQQLAPAWPLSQLALVDRNLLRLSIYELTIDKRTPPKAIINEAIELAKLFGGDSAPRFINGVLGGLMESLAQSPKP
jgi:N utilization substance protein B